MVKYSCGRCGKVFDNYPDAAFCEKKHEDHLNPEVQPGDIIQSCDSDSIYIVLKLHDKGGFKRMTIIHFEDDDAIVINRKQYEDFKFNIVTDERAKHEIFSQFDDFLNELGDCLEGSRLHGEYIRYMGD